MTVLSRELEIQATAETVWQQLIDVNGWKNWQNQISESIWMDDSEAGIGARFVLRYSHNRDSPRIEAEVSGFRAHKEFSYKPADGDQPYTEGMTDLEWEWLLFPQTRNRTRVRFTLTYDAAGGSPFFRELIGTRVQFLNFADTALAALRAMYEDEHEGETTAPLA